MQPAYEQTIRSLEAFDSSTSEQCLHLKDFGFSYHDGFPCLEHVREGGAISRFYFSDRHSHYAMKQYCQQVGIPFAYVKRCLEEEQDLNVLNFSRWAPKKLRQENVVKFRVLPDHPDKMFIRAILPKNYVTLSNLDVFKTLAEVVGDSAVLDGVDSLGDGDTPLFHVRVHLPEQVGTPEDPCFIGMSIVGSELGANSNQLIVNALLYRQICSNGAIATFGESPFFVTKYKGVQPEDLRTIFGSAVQRLNTELGTFRDKVIEAKASRMLSRDDLRKFFSELRTRRNIKHDIIDNLEETVLTEPERFATKWDLVNLITERAKTLDFSSRIYFESLGGDLLGLQLEEAA